MSDKNWSMLIERVRTELSGLAEFVDGAKQGIEGLESTVKLSSEKFPEASGQLKTVTGDLENAANTIMSILEGLIDEHDRGASLLKELSEWVSEQPDSAGMAKKIQEIEGINTGMKTNMMDMFANLAFHDLSGQKLKKVIGTLGVVESKILDIARSFGFEEILKGGGAKGEGASPFDQNEVDRLMQELKQGAAR